MLNPEIKVIRFEVADIITTSDTPVTCTNDNCPYDAGEF